MKFLTKIYDKIINKKKYLIAFLILIGIISSISVFAPSIRYSHDILFHLSRIEGIKDGLSMGVIPSVYSNYLGGYGYANPLFYPDIFLYIPGVLRYLGLGLSFSYKTLLLLTSIFSVITMYICVKGISKNKYAAIVSSILYGFSSYRLLDMFVRAAIGETIAFVFTPLVIYGIYKIIFEDYKKFYILVIGMSGLILSHLISTYIIAIILIILCLINIKQFIQEKQRIKYLIIAALCTILITGFFIFPMLEQMMSSKFAFNDITNAGLGNLSDRAVPLYALFNEMIGFNGKWWIPSGIGIVFIILIILIIKHRNVNDRIIKQFSIISIIFLLLSCNIFPWKLFDNMSLLTIIQFPWRFYLVPTLLLSIAGGMLFQKVYESKKSRVKALLVITILSLISCGVINGRVIFTSTINLDKYYISQGEYLPLGLTRDYIEERGDIITSNNQIIFTQNRVDNKMIIDFENNYNDTYLELPFIYYKGYTAKVDNEYLNVTKSDNGLVLVELKDKNTGTLTVKYEKTPIIYISAGVSIISVLVFSIYIYKIRKVEKNEENI
ncbi:MAG: YfhO family protein [Clostridium sp.]|nr:YfhO family protein [Clostridium sp.]MCM1444595.1 YfhO family protein [Candidatus Amulumruptor caecigallinarius]